MITSANGGRDDDRISETGGEHVLVGTRSGTNYLIDLRAMRLKRFPGSRGNSCDEGQTMAEPLRRDQQWLKIIHLGPMALGERLEIHLEPLGDPCRVAYTRRHTTEVISVIFLKPLRKRPGPASFPEP